MFSCCYGNKSSYEPAVSAREGLTVRLQTDVSTMMSVSVKDGQILLLWKMSVEGRSTRPQR